MDALNLPITATAKDALAAIKQVQDRLEALKKFEGKPIEVKVRLNTAEFDAQAKVLEGRIAALRGDVSASLGLANAGASAADAAKTQAAAQGQAAAAAQKTQQATAGVAQNTGAAAAAGKQASAAMREAAAGASDVVKTVKRIDEEAQKKVVEVTRQIGLGVRQLTTQGVEGKRTIVDTAPVAKLKEDLAAIGRQHGPRAAAAAGDMAKQIDLAKQKVEAIRSVLNQNAGVQFSPEFRKGLDQLAAARKQLFDLQKTASRDADTRALEQSLQRVSQNYAPRLATATGNTARQLQLTRDYARDLDAVLRSASGMELSKPFRDAQRQIAGLTNQARKYQTKIVDSQIKERQRQQVQADKDARKREEDALRREQSLIANTSGQRLARAGKDFEEKARIYRQQADALNRLANRAEGKGFTERAHQARGAAMRAETAAVKELNRSTVASGHAFNFHTASLLKNMASFVRWSLAVAAVTAVLGTFTSAISSAIAIERQGVRLAAVFQGTEREAAALRDTTLQLAAANARGTGEALESAIAFARLGTTQAQTAKLVESALVAANVAEVDAGRVTKDLSAVYASFRLSIEEIPAVIGEMNKISNIYNATVDDQLQAIARVSGVARQAGIEFSRLNAIMAAATGFTGRGGAEIGNALKTVIQRLTDVDRAEAFKKLGIETTDASGNLLRVDDILRNLVLRYNDLDRAQQANLRKTAAGIFQAARFSNIVDSYATGLALSARGQLGINSAVEENANLLGTADAKLKSFKATWEEFTSTLIDSGALNAIKVPLEALSDTIHVLSAVARDGLDAKIYPKSNGDQKVDPFPDLVTLKEKAGGLRDAADAIEVVRDRIEGAATQTDKLRQLDEVFGKLTGKSNERVLEFAGISVADEVRKVQEIQRAIRSGDDAGAASKLLEIETSLRKAAAANRAEFEKAFSAQIQAGERKVAVLEDRLIRLAERAERRGNPTFDVDKADRALEALRNQKKEVEDLRRLYDEAAKSAGDLGSSVQKIARFGELSGIRDKSISDTAAEFGGSVLGERGRVVAEIRGIENAISAVDAKRVAGAARVAEAERKAADERRRIVREAEDHARRSVEAAIEAERRKVEAERKRLFKDIPDIPEPPRLKDVGEIQRKYVDTGILSQEEADELKKRYERQNQADLEYYERRKRVIEKARDLVDEELRRRYGNVEDSQRVKDARDSADRNIKDARDRETAEDREARRIAEETTKLKEAYDKQTEELTKSLEEQKAKLEAARIRDAITLGRERFQNAILPADFGRSDTDRLASQIEALAGVRSRLARDIFDAPDLQSRRVAEAAANEAVSQAQGYQIQAARELAGVEQRRNQLLLDGAERLREQRREMSELLGLASREDQIRAASAAAADRRLREQGRPGIGSQSFAENVLPFLSESLKGALSRLSPEFNEGRENRKLSAEIAANTESQVRLASATERMAAAFEGAEPTFNTLFNGGGRGAEIDGATKPGDLIVNVGGVNVTFDVAGEIRRALTVTVDAVRAEFAARMGEIEEAVRRQASPRGAKADFAGSVGVLDG